MLTEVYMLVQEFTVVETKHSTPPPPPPPHPLSSPSLSSESLKKFA